MVRNLSLIMVGRLLVIGIAFLAHFQSAWAQDRAPNVLLIVSDDQRPDTISAAGNPHIQTPHLDELARQGTRFLRAVSPNPICTPSRGEILTGCSGFRNGVRDFGGRLDPQLIRLPQALREAGYHTWYVGKWHNDGRPRDHGYDDSLGLFSGGGGKWWKDQTDYRDHPVTGYRGWVFQNDEGDLFPQQGVGLTWDISARFAEAAIALLNRRPEQPFFLHLNFTAPHDPLLLPPQQAARRDDALPPLPANFLPEHPFDHGNLRGRDEELLPWPRTPELVRTDLAAYYAVIEHMDSQIGRILEALRDSRQWDNTIVIFTSDHGLAMGSHGLRGKQNMYEHTVGVPLIVRGPGLPTGRRSYAQVYLRDIYPTICELAGVEAPATVEATSFAAALRGRAQAGHSSVFGYFRDSQRMVRTQRYKLVHYPQAGQWQLFDLTRDPHEKNNLVGTPGYQTIETRLRRDLAAWQQTVGDPLAMTKDHDQLPDQE